MKAQIVILSFVGLFGFIFAQHDGYGVPEYQAPAPRQDAVPLGAIGALAVLSAIGGGAAVIKAAADRTTIQNSINTLSTTVNTLGTTVSSAATILDAQIAISATNAANIDLVCAAFPPIGGLTVDETPALQSAALLAIRAALTTVTCM